MVGIALLVYGFNQKNLIIFLITWVVGSLLLVSLFLKKIKKKVQNEKMVPFRELND